MEAVTELESIIKEGNLLVKAVSGPTFSGDEALRMIGVLVPLL